MSPLALRRYRAERLLREQFERMRGRVLAIVRARLGTCAAQLDPSDLDACYAQAWHGLYAAVMDGQQIVNPTGWLALVTYRRAIEETRSRSRATVGVADDVRESHVVADPDIAAELDDRTALRHLFEALRGRLNERELQAAALCYLQGLSRAEAAVRMGVSERRMRKLMEGTGRGSSGVAGKVGALTETIRAGGWCQEQASLMRGFAFGILDPRGERYQLAQLHHSDCPACRSYVLSLRGLAAVLPPAPSLLHLALGAGIAGANGTSAAVGGSGAHGSAALPAGSGVSGSALSGAGAAGAGAAGGGWLLAGGPLGAKLAVGCLLALGVGAGCVALSGQSGHVHAPTHRHLRPRAGDAGASNDVGAPSELASARRDDVPGVVRASAAAGGAAGSSGASREFGPEQRVPASGSRPAASSTGAASAASAAPRAQAASVAGQQDAEARPSPASSQPSSGGSAAQREFAPG